MLRRGASLVTGLLAFAPTTLFASSTTDSVCSGATTSCDPTALNTSVGHIVSTLLTVAGSVAVIIIIIGGLAYITSTGDSSRIKLAKDTILYAIIGLVVIIIAYAIVHFVITRI